MATNTMKQLTLFGESESVTPPQPKAPDPLQAFAQTEHAPLPLPGKPPTIRASECYEAVLDALRNQEDPTEIRFTTQ